MKIKNFSGITLCVFVFTIALHISCSSSDKKLGKAYDKAYSAKEAPSSTGGPIPRLDGKLYAQKIDMKKFYESGLKKYGINDFSTESLIRLMDSNVGSVRFFSASLLGVRKERSAIPRLEKALNDKSFVVREAATKALLQMGNRKGIPVLEDFCVKALKELENGDHHNTMEMLDSAKVLAEAGEVSAIPYLRQLLRYDYKDSWGVRLIAMRSLEKLYEKEPVVLTDISSMANDKEAQVRRESAEIVKRIQSKK